MLLSSTPVLKLLGQGKGLPKHRFVLGGPLHGTLQQWDYPEMICREPTSFKTKQFWSPDINDWKPPPTHRYLETRSYAEDAIDRNGGIEICKTYCHESINHNPYTERTIGEIAWCCWLLGISFPKQNGFFKIISLSKWYSFDGKDDWAVWAGLGYRDCSYVLSRLEVLVERFK